jgi:hypothetical protein
MHALLARNDNQRSVGRVDDQARSSGPEIVPSRMQTQHLMESTTPPTKSVSSTLILCLLSTTQ